MILEDAGVIGGGFGRGGGVDLAADILDLFGDLTRRSARRALEGHVFEKVSDPVLCFGFVARSGFDPDAESGALEIRHVFGNDRQPGLEPGTLNIHRL